MRLKISRSKVDQHTTVGDDLEDEIDNLLKNK